MQSEETVIYILAWVPMVPMAIANGIFRDRVYKKQLTELKAHQLSTLIAAVIFTLYTGALSYQWQLNSAGQALAIGGIWLVLTITFEFVFGHFAAKFTWRRLVMDYNVTKGRVWALLLVWLFLLPLLVYCLGPNKSFSHRL